MDIIRSIARSLCAIGLGLTIGAWIIIATVNETALNRGVTKQWLAQSGIYNTDLGSIAQIQTTSGENTSEITSQALSEALKTTFPPDYIKQGSETVLDGVYDWLDGKQQAITFAIPVQEKAEEFKTNLANALAPKLEGLPPCASRLGNTTSDPTCIPIGLNAQDYARQLANNANGSFFKEPLTAQSFGQPAHTSQIDLLLQAAQMARTSALVLPFAALLFAGLFILLSRDRLQGTLQIGRQLVISSIFLLAGGLIMWYVGNTVDIGANTDASSKNLITNIINPLAHTIIPGIGSALSLFSGAVMAVGVVIWVTAHTLIRKRPHPFPAGSHPQPMTPSSYAIPAPTASQPTPQPPSALSGSQPPVTQKSPPSGPPKPPVIQ